MFAPSVQMQDVPGDQYASDDEDEEDADDRYPQSFWDRRIVPDNEYYDSDEGEAQGTTQNLSSRHYHNYGRDDDEDYDGDESDGNRMNGNKYNNHTRASSSSTSVEDRMEGVEVTQEEEQQIEETLLADKVKTEPEDSNNDGGSPANEILGEDASSDVSMKEEAQPAVAAQTQPSESITAPGEPAGEENTPAQTSSPKQSTTALESEEEGEVVSSGKSASPGPQREPQQSEAVAAAVASAVASTVIAPPNPSPNQAEPDTSSQPTETPHDAAGSSVLEDGEIED